MSKHRDDLLASKAFWLAARGLLTVVFALAGVAKVADFDGDLTEMSRAGLEPACFFNIAVAVILLGGTPGIRLNRYLSSLV